MALVSISLIVPNYYFLTLLFSITSTVFILWFFHIFVSFSFLSYRIHMAHKYFGRPVQGKHLWGQRVWCNRELCNNYLFHRALVRVVCHLPNCHHITLPINQLLFPLYDSKINSGYLN